MPFPRSRSLLTVILSCGLWTACGPGSGGGGTGGLGGGASGGSTTASSGSGGSSASTSASSSSGAPSSPTSCPCDNPFSSASSSGAMCPCNGPSLDSSPGCYDTTCAPWGCAYSFTNYPVGVPCGPGQVCSGHGNCMKPAFCFHDTECGGYGGCCCSVNGGAQQGSCTAPSYCTAPSACLP